MDQPIDAELMQKLQKKIMSEQEVTAKYNMKAALIAGDRRHTCETFDSRDN